MKLLSFLFGVYTFANVQILIQEIKSQKENIKKPLKIIFLNDNIDIYKTVWPHSWNLVSEPWFHYYTLFRAL